MQRFQISKNKFAILTGVAALVATVGCKPPENAGGHGHGQGQDQHDDGHEDEHDHAEVTFPITVWENGHEVFAEHGEVVVNEPVEFVTHVTELETGLPHAEGSIRFIASKSDGATFEHLETTPANPGVYLPQLTFPVEGEWDLKILIPHADKSVEVQLGYVDVQGEHEEEEEHADHEDEHGHEEAVDGIQFLKEQQWNHAVLVHRVERRELGSFETFAGKTTVASGAHGTVRTPISGRLSPVRQGAWPRPGQRVEAGDVLFLIEPMFSDQSTRLVEAQAAVERAKISLQDARTTFERIEILVREEARSVRDLQAARKILDLARNDLQSALAVQKAYEMSTLNAGSEGGTPIPIVAVKAPVAGVINEVMPHSAGEFVESGTELLHTLDASRVYVVAHVRETFGSRVSSIGSARVRSSNADQWKNILDGSTGELVALGMEVDPATRTFPVTIEASNDDGLLRIGQQLSVQLQLGDSVNALALPVEAIVEEEGLEAVFVQVAGETFQKRFVQTGRRDGDWVELIDGVAEGEMVVSRGAYAIRLASVAGNEIPHAHH